MKEEKPSIVMFSTADWDNPFWTNKQHMALHLARRGYRILYVESIGLRKPTINGSDMARIWRRLKRAFKSVRRVDKNIWVFSPFVFPLHSVPLIRLLNSLVLRFSFFILQKRLGFKSVWVWTYHPLVIDYLKFFKIDKLVYHSVDDLTAAPRSPVKEIKAAEEILLKRANFTFVTSLALKEKYEQTSPNPVHYFPNVADYDHFHSTQKPETSIPADLQAIPQPRIGFIGAISGYKVDFDLIAEIARKKPEWHWILIGKVGEGDPATDISKLALPNIHLLGPREYPFLPGYLKGFDVTVIPCVLNDYTRAMFPMKFFEYLAAGKLIVTTELPSLRDFKDLYLQGRDPKEFQSAIESVLDRKFVFTEKMSEAALENTWEKRLDKMLVIIGKSP